jgi:tetratricopeptide (TPR) repeat protein
MKRLFVLSILLILFFSFSVTCLAQQPDQYRINLELAKELMRVGQPEEAIKIINQLRELFGDKEELRELLKEALLSLKEYDRVEQMIKEDLSARPQDWMLYTQLGNVYIQTQRMEEAKQNLDRAIQLSPKQKRSYQEVAFVYLRNNLRAEAMDTYKLARMKLGVPNVFSLDLANLYEQLFDYKQAVNEYFLFMGNDSTKFDLVEDRINRLIETDQHLDAIELALRERIKDNPRDKYSHKLYGDLLFRRNDLEDAFESYKKVDEISETNGRYILRFVQMCINQELYDQAIKSAQFILSGQYPKDVMISAQLYIARSYEGQEKYGEAIATYNDIINSYQKDFPHEVAFAHFQIGEINLLRFKKPDEALPRYQSVVSNFSGAKVYPTALVRRGDCMLAKGELDSARAFLNTAAKDPQADVMMEEILFKLTEIEFFEGNFEEALEGYSRLVLEFPKGFYVNNSLERTILINEHQELDRPLLARFAGALFENVQGKAESAISQLDGLIEAESEKLSDLAQMEKARIYREERKFSKSLETLVKLLEKYPESFLCPQAQMMIGDIYNYHLNDRDKAIEAYRNLLKDYERSVYVDEVRDKLRELKAEVSPSSSG